MDFIKTGHFFQFDKNSALRKFRTAAQIAQTPEGATEQARLAKKKHGAAIRRRPCVKRSEPVLKPVKGKGKGETTPRKQCHGSGAACRNRAEGATAAFRQRFVWEQS
ncbi:MAG: hypothetical protein IJ523_03865 [Succinivibrionaceae bacterium]|nr:hypothetical protein [Succinivibrionaceae bacterium]